MMLKRYLKYYGREAVNKQSFNFLAKHAAVTTSQRHGHFPGNWWKSGKEGDPISWTSWGYNGSKCDPQDWPTHFNCGSGMCQSPIDIDMSTVRYSKDLQPLTVSYQKKPDYLINDGQCIRVHYDKGSTISGANLEGEFEVVQFHFHWGSKKGTGSEHLIDGEGADAELHIVHINKKYKDVFEAMEQSDGLAVLGVFLREDGQKANNALKPITERFSRLTEQNHQYKCKDPFDLTTMLPDLTQFVTYDGSLTTPPLKQCVKWIVVREALHVSPEEMELFRHLETCFGPNFIDNFRPPQPLNGRVVQCNFKSSK